MLATRRRRPSWQRCSDADRCARRDRIPARAGTVTSARRGAVPGEALVDERDDLVERIEGLALLRGDAADERVDALDVCGSAEQRARGGRWLAEALGRLGVLLELSLI